MQRWSYLVPRLIMLGLICAALLFGRDMLIRAWAIHSVESSVGARAEMGQLQTSISKGRVFINDLKIADPRDPMLNLIQADMATFAFDPEKFLRREFVIESGRTSRLMLGVPRTVSGSLRPLDPTATPIQDDPNNEVVRRDFAAEAERLGQQWLDQIQPEQGLADGQIQFELTDVATRIRSDWNEVIHNYERQVAQIGPQIDRLRIELQQEYENPLRDVKRHAAIGQELEKLESDSSRIRQQLEVLNREIENQKTSLTTAKTRDEQKLRQLTRSNQFDGQAVSELLLHEYQGRLVEEVVQWLGWFRTAMPDPDHDFAPRSTRGVNVTLPGRRRGPTFLIKQLDIEGEGRFAGQHLNFAGTAFNLTTQPKQWDLPASFELRAQGHQHLIIQCVIDRRNEQPIDQLVIECPDLEVPEKLLGSQDVMLVSLGPGSKVQASVDLEVRGDQISGNLFLSHSNVALHVDHLHSLAGGEDTALRLNQDLIRVNEFKTDIAISGSLAEYDFELTSDLGSRFSATVDRVVIAEVDARIEAQKTKLNRMLAEEIGHLEHSIAPRLKQLSGLIRRDILLMAEINQSLEQSEDQSGLRIRR